MKDKKRLPESEEDIMLVVWGAKGPVSATAILEALGRSLTASALHSYLKRLEEKGFLACRKEGKSNYYTPLVAEEDYRRTEGGAVLERLYHGSLKTFAAALWDGGKLTAAEVAELKSYLEELSKEGKT